MNCRQEVVDAIPCRRPHTDDSVLSSRLSVLSENHRRVTIDIWQLITRA